MSADVRLQEFLDAQKHRAANQAVRLFQAIYDDLNRDTESPIESLFAAALAGCWIVRAPVFFVSKVRDERLSVWVFPRSNPTLDSGLRPDFLLECIETATRSPLPVQVAIELDGHVFHERTKEQAEHDRRRERQLIGDGLVVIRFTGREVYRNPNACVNEALELLEAEVIRRRFPEGVMA